jgi:hypothetical protein
MSTTRLQLRVCLLAMQKVPQVKKATSAAVGLPQAAAAQTSSSGGDAKITRPPIGTSAPALPTNAFVWLVQPLPPATAAATPAAGVAAGNPLAADAGAAKTATDSSPPPSTQLAVLAAGARRRVRPTTPWWHRAAAKLSSGVAEGQEWLSRAQAGTMRARAHQAFLAVQSRIDARENALAAVHLFVQRARKHEEEVETAVLAEVAQRAAATAATTKALTVSSSSAASSSTDATSAASPTTSAAVAIPAPMSFTLTFLYPSSEPAASVRSYLRRFSAERMQFHTRRALLYAVLLPVTTLATVLPGPNVLFAAAAYRLLGHYQARQGAEEIIKLLGDSDDGVEESKLSAGKSAAASGADESLPPVELELQSFELSDADADASTLEQLCRKLQLDFAAAEAAVARWKS